MRTRLLTPPSSFDAVKSDDGVSCADAVCDLQIHCVVTCQGHLDHVLLNRAMRLSFDAEPVLGSRFVAGRWRQFWQRREDLDHLEFCSLAHTDNPEKDIINYLAIPLDLRNAPLIQVRIFRSQNDTLCLKANHIVTDAGGVKEYLRLLSDIYRALMRNPEYRPSVNLSGRRSHGQIFERLSMPDYLRVFLRSVKIWRDEIYPPRNWSFPSQGRDLSRRTFLIHRLPPEVYERIKAYSGERHCTVNDIMTAAFFRAFYQLLRPPRHKPLRLGITVDLRRYLPEKRAEAIANFASLFSLNIGGEIGDTFEETVLLVRNRMDRHKKNCIGLELTKTSLFALRWFPFSWRRRLAGLMGRLSHLLGPKVPPPWLTNMGVLRKEDLLFGNVGVMDAILTAPLAFPPFFAVGLSGFQNTITMSAGVCPNSVDPGEVKKLFALVEEYLRGLRIAVNSCESKVDNALNERV